MEFDELLYGRRFPLRLKGVLYKSYVGPAILYGSDVLCLTGNEMEIFRTEIYGESNMWSTHQIQEKILKFCVQRDMVRAICGVHVRYRKRYGTFEDRDLW